MKRKVLRTVVGVLVLGVLLGSAALGTIVWCIHRLVWQYCVVAQQAHPHPGDDLPALADFMDSASHSLRERNLAVWTLGRLRNPNALPALERVYSGSLCDHSEYLCQYELEKAIKLCGGVPNPPRKARRRSLEP